MIGGSSVDDADQLCGQVSKSIDAARKALTGPHGKDNKKVHASAGDKGKDSRHPASAVLGQGGVKRKREPIPAPPPSRGGVATSMCRILVGPSFAFNLDLIEAQLMRYI